MCPYVKINQRKQKYIDVSSLQKKETENCQNHFSTLPNKMNHCKYKKRNIISLSMKPKLSFVSIRYLRDEADLQIYNIAKNSAEYFCMLQLKYFNPDRRNCQAGGNQLESLVHDKYRSDFCGFSIQILTSFFPEQCIPTTPYSGFWGFNNTPLYLNKLLYFILSLN